MDVEGVAAGAVAGAATTDRAVLITCNAVFANCSGIASILLRREEEPPTLLVDVMTQISPEILVQDSIRALLRLY
jgi:hypothetical protein